MRKVNKNKVGKINIRAKFGLDRAHNSNVDMTNIEVGKKTNIKACLSTNKDINDDDKRTNQYAHLVNLY